MGEEEKSIPDKVITLMFETLRKDNLIQPEIINQLKALYQNHSLDKSADIIKTLSDTHA